MAWLETDYRVKLEVFEGPFDLLYHLVEKNEIDIWDIPIAKITEQYLAYLEEMRRLDIEIAAEFLVIAARLLQIKARMLLPEDPAEVAEDEDDPRIELAVRLLEYKVFKEVAAVLEEKAALRWGMHGRPRECAPKPSGHVYEYQEGDVTADDLAKALQRALAAAAVRPKEIPVPTKTVSVTEKIQALRRYIRSKKSVRFSALLRRSRSRAEIVATFLALLELIRQRVVLARQDTVFGAILIEAYGDAGE